MMKVQLNRTGVRGYGGVGETVMMVRSGVNDIDDAIFNEVLGCNEGLAKDIASGLVVAWPAQPVEAAVAEPEEDLEALDGGVLLEQLLEKLDWTLHELEDRGLNAIDLRDYPWNTAVAIVHLIDDYDLLVSWRDAEHRSSVLSKLEEKIDSWE